MDWYGLNIPAFLWTFYASPGDFFPAGFLDWTTITWKQRWEVEPRQPQTSRWPENDEKRADSTEMEAMKTSHTKKSMFKK